MQKGFSQVEGQTSSIYHLIFLEFWCIMQLCWNERCASLLGNQVYQAYTLHQKSHQYTHTGILDNSRYGFICVVLSL